MTHPELQDRQHTSHGPIPLETGSRSLAVEKPRLILASASGSRLRALRAAGLDPIVEPSNVDESLVVCENPSELVSLLAQLKCEAIVHRHASEPFDDRDYVLGCDTMLSLDGKAIGKPSTAKQVKALWNSFGDRSAELLTGHFLQHPRSGANVKRTVTTLIRFAKPSFEELETYIARGEPFQAAGGFNINGVGGSFIRGVEGDPHNVAGVSLPTLREMFMDLGVIWTSLWSDHSSGDSDTDSEIFKAT